MRTKKMPPATASVGALDLANSCWLLLPFSLVGNTLQEVVSSSRRQLLGEKISQVKVCVQLRIAVAPAATASLTQWLQITLHFLVRADVRMDE